VEAEEEAEGGRRRQREAEGGRRREREYLRPRQKRNDSLIPLSLLRGQQGIQILRDRQKFHGDSIFVDLEGDPAFVPD
jgi:hypothetical protein